MTAAPSPTAAATRLVEPARTSPTAKIPGQLVSSGSRSPSRARSPVRTKPVPSPEEIADLVAWLTSPGAGYMTGASLTIDGGWTA